MLIIHRVTKRESLRCFFTIILLVCLGISVSSCTKQEKVLSDLDLYNQAMEYMGRKKYQKAGESLDRLEQEYPESVLMSEARLSRADIHFRLKEFDEARGEYERFLNLHPVHPQADLARFRIAMTYFEQIINIDRDQRFTIKALEAFERFLKEYPQSPFISEAKDKVSICRLKLAEQDFYIARFYLKTGSYQASRGRLQKIWNLYPNVPWRDEVLYLLSETYQREGMSDEAMQTLCYLYRIFPNSPFIEKIRVSCQEIGSEYTP